MATFQEPDDVDFVVDGRDSDPDSIRETIEYIKEYKSRPGYADELKEALAILDSLRKNPGYVPPDPDALLAQWRRNVEEFHANQTNGTSESIIKAQPTEELGSSR